MIGKEIAEKLQEKYNAKSILFCPYKEEMWDSMKTIYDNVTCEKDIMPIAYYTLDNMIPKHVKIEFEEYKHNFPLALDRRWDVIIFHYPYDNLNNVTRPLLLSNELKAFCKHLVLVGYAVVGGRLPFLQEVCYAGVRNSDLVIHETEEQAKEAMKLLEGQPNWHGECVGWGSAKYDMVELVEIPTEWEEKAQGRRKVFLQTGLVPFLKNNNKLNQVESIIKSYANNDKVCLVWRHHPLLRDTIIAHNRNGLKRFDDLIETVKKSSKDIYDETKIPETPIKFADEMITDNSSLVFLWKSTGKKLTILE